MSQRPSANRAVFRVKEKLGRTSVTGKWKCGYIDNWFKFENQRDVGIINWNLLESLNLSWLQRVRNTRIWRAVIMIITFRRDLHLKYVICNSSAVILKFVAFRAKKKNTAYYNKCMRLVMTLFFLWFVYILPLEMTLKEGSGNVPLLDSDW